MKKIIAALLACAMLLGCVCFAESGFEPMKISLWADDSGYEWTCEYADNGVLSEPMYEFIADENGTGGTYEFHFGILKSGTAHLVFNYGVSWGIAAPLRTMVCSVTVDEFGKAEIRSAECFGDDNIVVVKLPGNPSTGWTWNYETAETGMITLLDEEFQPYSDDLATAGGITEYEFQVTTSGAAMLMFNYANMWDPYAAAEETFVLSIAANDDMEISLNIEEYAPVE